MSIENPKYLHLGENTGHLPGTLGIFFDQGHVRISERMLEQNGDKVREPDVCEIQFVSVDDESAGRGFGTELMAHAVELARAAGYTKFYADCDNAKSITMLEKLFKEVPHKYFLPGGDKPFETLVQEDTGVYTPEAAVALLNTGEMDPDGFNYDHEVQFIAYEK